MTTHRLRLLLVGEQAAGIRVLRALVATPHEVVAVATTLDGEATPASTVQQAAQRLALPLLPAASVADRAFSSWIEEHAIDLYLNVFSLRVAAPETVRAARIGSFNLHPGPLPECAGLNAPSWAVYHGERRHAATLHWMTERIDAGPIAYESSFAVGERETGLTLTQKCVEHGLPLVMRLLDDAAAGSIPAAEQDAMRRRYFGAGVPEQGRLRWSRRARDLDRFVRACDYLPFASPWGHPRSRLRGMREWIEITKTAPTGEVSREAPGTVQRAVGKSVVVAAADERLLVEGIRLAGKSRTPTDLLQVGSVLEEVAAAEDETAAAMSAPLASNPGRP